ncbi:MAG TPA: HD domain-containing protein [Planctomycetaceae bacterium]|nr:HD domain-containing protein [Planctomycetaceae bacterium]
MESERLARQIAFIVEIDRLKGIFRQTWLMDGTRRENDAEHSWHVAIMAVLLAEYAAAGQIDLLRVLQMLLVHDLVEIDAGDTYVYDTKGSGDKVRRERRAAERIFGLLPPDQAERMRGWWEEFEACQTPEARFAAALDRFQPLLHNYQTGGRTWQTHGVAMEQVLEVNRRIDHGAPALWQYAERLIEDAVRREFLKR